jgi:hypothetical protein
MTAFASEVIADTRAAQRAAGWCMASLGNILGDETSAKGKVDFEYRDIPSRSEFEIKRDPRGGSKIEISVYQLQNSFDVHEDTLRVKLSIGLSPDGNKMNIQELKSTRDGKLVDDINLKREGAEEKYGALAYQLRVIETGLQEQNSLGSLSNPGKF